VNMAFSLRGAGRAICRATARCVCLVVLLYMGAIPACCGSRGHPTRSLFSRADTRPLWLALFVAIYEGLFE